MKNPEYSYCMVHQNLMDFHFSIENAVVSLCGSRCFEQKHIGFVDFVTMITMIATLLVMSLDAVLLITVSICYVNAIVLW